MGIGATGPRFRTIPGNWQRVGILAAASLVNQSITYTADTPGTEGNTITVAIVAGGAGQESRALSVDVTGTAIVITPATDGAGAITTTRADVVAAVNGDVDAAALVTAAGVGATVITALAATPLTGGSSYVFGTMR